MLKKKRQMNELNKIRFEDLIILNEIKIRKRYNQYKLLNQKLSLSKLIIINLILIITILINQTKQQDDAICLRRFAKFTHRHTACLKPNQYCQITKQGITGHDKQVILDVHNYYRNLIASGNESSYGFPSAANMLTLEWDDELAYVAQKHANQCKFEHDCYDCRRTEQYPVVGQNLYTYRTTRSSAEPNWQGIIKEWYEEIRIAPPQVAHSFDLFQLNIGHFTQIAWAETNRIGCGYSTYANNEGGSGSVFKTVQLYTCNYAPGGNYLGEKMYENGPPISKCPPQYSPSRHFNALCESSVRWSTSTSSRTSVSSVGSTYSSTSGSVFTNSVPISTTVSTVSEQPTILIVSNTPVTPVIYNTPTSVATTLRTITSTRTTNGQRNRNRGRNRSRTSTRTNVNRNSDQGSRWTSRLNNWKNNSTIVVQPTTTIASTRIIPTTYSSVGTVSNTPAFKWSQPNSDWKKWLTNYTTFTNWTQWSKPRTRSAPATITTNVSNNSTVHLDPRSNIVLVNPSSPTSGVSSANSVPWRLSNVTWVTNWTNTQNRPRQNQISNFGNGRATTRLPTYTWALSLGYQRDPLTGNINSISNNNVNQQPGSYSWSRSVDMTPNRLNSNLYTNYNRYNYNNRYF